MAQPPLAPWQPPPSAPLPTPTPRYRSLRIPLIALAGLLAVGGVLGVYLTHFGIWKFEPTEDAKEPPTPAEVASVERKRRQTPAAEIAPAPLPTALPLLGEAGTRPDGYPKPWVSKPGLRSLLFHRKLDELTRYMEEIQTAFEADPKKEYWVYDAGDAFDTAEPALASSLDAWVAAKPDSFAPWLARGIFRVEVAQARRGTAFSKDTHDDNLAAMHEAHAAARLDLAKALELRPKALAAARGLQIIENDGGGRKAEVAANERAFAVCATCMQPRVTAMWNATPRWGGSKEEMAAIAAAAPVAQNARLRLLPGIIDLEDARTLREAKKPDEAFAAVERACARGPYSESLLERADALMKRDDDEGALRAIEDALADRPGRVGVLEKRLLILERRKAWRRAYDDLIEILRVNSTSKEAKRLKPYAVSGLRSEAEELLKKGNRNGALDLFDLAANLAPFDRKLQDRRADVVAAKPYTREMVEDAEKAVAATPGDFRAVQRLDYLVSGGTAGQRGVDLWTEFLKLHPDDGRAYLERGGAYINLRKMDLAKQDARRACELGVSEGCGRAVALGEIFPAAPSASP